MFWRTILLMCGVYACSTAVIMVKLCDVHPVLLAGYRQLVAAVVLLPLFIRDWRRSGGAFTRSHALRSFIGGALLGAHFVSWIVGARLTLTANASIIVNMAPAAMPFFLHVLIGEKLTRGEWLGTALALTGVIFLSSWDLSLDRAHFAGDAICLGSMVLFAWYLALGRRNRDFPSVWLYLVPLYFAGGVLCFAVSLFQVSPLAIPSWTDGLYVLGLGVVPTVIGHSILNYSMRHIRGQAVSLTNLTQFIFAGATAYILWRELPHWPFAVAAPTIVLGVVVALQAAPKPKPTPVLSTREGQP